MNNDTIGVDVSKDHLDAHQWRQATRRFANTKGGHKALIKWVAETPIPIPCSKTDRTLSSAPSNARWASLAFCSSRSIRARRAASPRRPASWRRPIRWMRRSWLRMVALLGWRRAQPSELLFELKELYVAREALVKDRTAAKNPRKSSAARC